MYCATNIWTFFHVFLIFIYWNFDIGRLVLSSSIWMQVRKKIFGIINKLRGPNKLFFGGGGEVVEFENNSKINKLWGRFIWHSKVIKKYENIFLKNTPPLPVRKQLKIRRYYNKKDLWNVGLNLRFFLLEKMERNVWHWRKLCFWCRKMAFVPQMRYLLSPHLFIFAQRVWLIEKTY